MKNTCKSWLQVITACISLSATTWGQSPGPGFPEVGSPQIEVLSTSEEDYGSVRLGGPHHSASAVVQAPAVQQMQFVQGAPQMFNEAMIPQDNSVGFAATRPDDNILWRVGRSSNDRYGFDGGYTNINAFIPFSIDSDRSLWWINPRVNITDYAQGATSLGFGHRVYNPAEDRVYGASFWWDYENRSSGYFNQLGGSFESIGRYTDLRMNFSLPIGEKIHSTLTGVGSSQFVGNQIAVQQFINQDEALQTYDVEVATPFPGLGGYGVDLGVGAYLLNGKESGSTVGVSVRSQAQINNNFWLNALYTNDPTFGSNLSINFELTMPTSSQGRWFRQRPVASSLTDSVIRRYRIPIDTTVGARSITAINPKTGLAFQVAHVAPDETGLGTGSITNPFMSIEQFDTLPAAEKAAFDIIYVQPRADNTDTNLNTGVNLLSGQYLLSNSVPQFVEAVAGVFQMPGFVPNQPLPLLTSTGIMGNGNVVNFETGGNCFTVAGFEISREMTVAGPNAGVGSAIFGTDVSDVNINRNILRNSEYATDLTFSGSLSYTQNILRDNTVGGLRVDYQGDGQLALFSNSTFNNMGVGLQVIADGSTVLANSLPDFVPPAPSVITPNFSNLNSILDLTDPDVDAQVIPFDPARMSTGIIGNQVALNETGMLLEAINGGAIEVNVEENLFTDNQDTFTGGFVANAEGVGSSITFDTFVNNTAQFNIGNGVLLSALDGGTINTPLRVDPTDPLGLNMIAGFGDNTLNGNLRNGLALVVDNSEVNDFVLGNNTIQGNRENGIGLFLEDATFAGWVIEDSVITENEDDGIALVMFNTTGTDLSILNNDISNNLANGYNVVADNSVLDDLLIEGNTITGNGSLISQFNITLAFNTQTGDPGLFAGNPLTALTPAEQALVQASARRWEELIVGDLPDVDDPMFSGTFGTIDDILLLVDGENYNGTGVLGVSYGLPSMLRPASGLPYWGLLTVINDGSLDATDYFSVALHELGHSLGFRGSTFGAVEASTGMNVYDPVTDMFQGTTAVAEHNAAFGLSATSIQLSPGSGHWQDPLYQEEFMFPSISLGSGVVKPQSRMTVGLFEDLGYVVNLNAADAYPPGPIVSGVTTGEGLAMDLQPGSFTPPNFDASPLFELPLDGTFVDAQNVAGGRNGIQIDLTDSEITNVTLLDNLIDANSQDGVRAELRGASTMNLNSSRDIMTNSGANGMEVIVRDTSIATIDLMNSTITDNGANGFLGNTFNATALSVSVTSPVDPDFTGITTLSNNGQNGLSIISSPDAPSTNTSLVDLLVDNVLIDGNGQRGIDILSTEMSIFDEMLIQDSIIMGNGADGIGMNRQHDGFINGTFLRNLIDGNGEEGIELISQNANTVDTYLIQDNIIRGNTRGIHLRVEADAVIDATINSNLIESNASHGIHVTERSNSALDQRNVIGIWTQNEIVNNGGSGIQLDGTYGIDSTLEIGQNGNDIDGFSLGNIISGNGSWGIRSNAVGIADINNNLITDNGAGGININSVLLFGNIIGIDNNFISGNGGIGVELFSDNNASLVVDATNNTISDNRGDGFELVTRGIADSTVLIDNNIIFDNDGRGVDILNAGNSVDSRVDLVNNTITVNGGEGVYVVNTASASQTAFKDAATPNGFPLTDETHGMEATGSIFSDPRLVFNMDNNIVSNNGLLSAFPATGFVMRVGTSGGGFGFTFDGGYASDGLGGVVATVTNNVFSGNFGTDVWFESFTSTVDPPITNGTWSNTAFTFNAPYRSDPLARLDLVFTGNTGNSVDVTNSGAWYDNAEPLFKSRLNNIAAPNIPGPFQSATRRRNAQRLASRAGLPPFVGPGLAFLYPGMGTSTFRVSAASTIGGIGSGMSNEFDVIGSTFNSGAPIDFVPTFGELFFDWDTTFVP